MRSFRAMAFPAMGPLRPGLWSLGVPEEVRLRQVELLIVPVRWAVVAFAAVTMTQDTGRSPALAWALPVLIVLTNVVATAMPRRAATTARTLRHLAVLVTAADGAVVVAAMFNYARNVDSATALLPVLVVMEAGIRWGRLGGIASGLAFGGISIGWMAYRDGRGFADFRTSAAIVRGATFLLAGVLLGTVVHQLELAGRELRRRLRRTDAVGRFAIDAPRLDLDEAAVRLARILHEDLAFERAAVVMSLQPDRGMFRLVATAGYGHLDVSRYREFPLSEGVVGRCFRTGEAQLVTDVRADPDYLEVDPETRSEMAVPLRSGEQVFGVIDIASTRLSAFNEEDLRFLETVGAQLGRAFDNVRLAELERSTIQELERLSAMKDDFIAIANHELRTPVTTIAGFAQSLLKQRDVLTQEEIDDAIERIARQSARLRGLIENLLAVPRVETGFGGLVTEAVPVGDLARETLHDIEPHDGRRELVVDVPSDLPAVRGDPVAVRRVLMNLVSNAIRYSPEGRPVVVRARVDGGSVRVEVVDRGLGIRADDLPHLFQKFGLLNGGDAAPTGMGLGLFIVKGLVEQMGGTVGVRSTPGHGSTFWFRLPRADAAVAEAAASAR